MNANELYEYIERIANLNRTSVRRVGVANGLQPVQVEALHYLSRCNRYSNTPVAVAEFLGLTKGTVSQTLCVLEANGFIRKESDARDRRVVHIQLTAEGENVLDKSIPPDVLRTAVERFTDSEMSQASKTMELLLRRMQQANGLKSFGACKTCVHHERTPDSLRHCGLTREILSNDDAEKICREHQPASAGAELATTS